MKNQNVFLIACCAIAVPFTHSMDKHPLNHIREIAAVNNPLKAHYITEQSIVVESLSDRSKCNIHIVDLNTYNTHLINESPYPPLSQVNGKKILMYCYPHLILYDIEKNIQEWSWEQPANVSALAWNPSQDTVFLCEGSTSYPLTQYNYRTNIMTKLPIQHPSHTIAIHPKQDIMCLADYSTNLYLYQIKDVKQLKKESLNNIGTYSFCQYNSDGSYLMAGDTNKIYFIDQNINQTVGSTKYPCIKKSCKEFFTAIAVHSTIPIVALLCRNTIEDTSVIRYFNINTQKLIEKSPKIITGWYDISHCSLDFSPNGFNIIAVAKGKCVEMPVSFLHKMREKYLFPLFALKHINDHNKNDHLPQDVTNHCAQMLLNTFKF